MSFSQLKTDRILARRVAAGDSGSFDEFFKEYFPRLFRFTLTRTNGNADLAEEVVQQAMCKVVRKMGDFRGEALLFTWLCQICRNELVSVYRRRGIKEELSVPYEDIPEIRAALESMSVGLSGPEAQQTGAELAKFVRVTLAHLPLKYATALELKYIRGCTVDEIAERLNISSKAAESVLSRARAAFKEGFRSLWDFEPNFLLD
ncbi:MAG: sigma-70 family RNA polymerase sigma factor [Gammaproteobacteria bacterium]|nr:sigma-70 family RNA polymerase sigma factor [Gammaproteobacteria bacterium]